MEDMTMPPSADTARELLLVLRAQSGDIAALGELFERVGPRIASHIRYIIRDDSLAEDALQEVFLIVHRKLGWLRSPETFRPWVYRIASREAIRMAKKQRTRPDQGAGDEAFDWSAVPDRSAGDAETRAFHAEIVYAVAGVSPASRAVISLHYLEDLTLHEAAAVLGIPVGTAKSRLAAGIEQLRAQLGRGTRRRA
jgi:RNA polymerase sigma-70 factor (ECF subfamily)